MFTLQHLVAIANILIPMLSHTKVMFICLVKTKLYLCQLLICYMLCGGEE